MKLVSERNSKMHKILQDAISRQQIKERAIASSAFLCDIDSLGFVVAWLH
jgi:hypothetical protein